MDPIAGEIGANIALGTISVLPIPIAMKNENFLEYINTLDEASRMLLKEHEGEFQSKEEIERFLSMKEEH